MIEAICRVTFLPVAILSFVMCVLGFISLFLGSAAVGSWGWACLLGGIVGALLVVWMMDKF